MMEKISSQSKKG